MKTLLKDSLSRYFNSLSNSGYINHEEVDKLLILTFIQELLDSDCREFITADEYLNIHKALYCLCGQTCLISYPEYKSNTTVTLNCKEL